MKIEKQKTHIKPHVPYLTLPLSKKKKITSLSPSFPLPICRVLFSGFQSFFSRLLPLLSLLLLCPSFTPFPHVLSASSHVHFDFLPAFLPSMSSPSFQSLSSILSFPVWSEMFDVAGLWETYHTLPRKHKLTRWKLFYDH